MLKLKMIAKNVLLRSICLSLLLFLEVTHAQQPSPAAAKSHAQSPEPARIGIPPATILIIRHAEKLTDGRLDLSSIGFKRAGLLPKLFARGVLPTPDVIFAAHQSLHSNRPFETASPLADSLHLKIDNSIANEDYAFLAKELLGGKYSGKVVLIVWHHGNLPALASALGAQPPYASWPDQQFDRIWRIDYKDGKAILNDLPQHLLDGDSN